MKKYVGIILIMVSSGFLWAKPFRYAVVVKNTTASDPSWAAVIDTLLAKYGVQAFIHTGNVWDVKTDLSDYKPTHICYLAQVSDIHISRFNRICKKS